MRALRDLIGEGADVCRWLHGDALPPLRSVARMEKLFGIRSSAWFARPKKAAA